MSDSHLMPNQLIRRRVEIVFAGLTLLFCLLLISSAFPGGFSKDAASMYSGGVSGKYDSNNSPFLSTLWGLMHTISGGPGGFLVAQQSLIWTGFFLCAVAFSRHFGPWNVLILLSGLSPQIITISTHLWKDVHLGASLLFSAGLLALVEARQRAPGKWANMLVLFALAYASMCRVNALFAVLPLAAWWCQQNFETKLSGQHVIRRIFVLTTVGVVTTLIITFGTTFILGYIITISDHDQPSKMLVGDIGQIYVTTGINYFPDGNAPATREEFSKLITRFSTPVRRTIPKWDKPERGQLFSAWLEAIWNHPGTYLSFRIDRMKMLMGLDGPREQRGSKLKFGFWAPVNKHNVQFVPNRLTRLHERYVGYFARTLVVKAWPWVLVCILCSFHMVYQLRRKVNAFDKVRLFLGLSALAYLLPYFVIAPAASYRYIFWPIVVGTVLFASYLAQLLSLFTRFGRSRESSA